MKHSQLSHAAQVAGARASADKRREKADARAIAAGVDPRGPRNKWGQLCVVKSCEVCAGTFLAYWPQADKRKTCSSACSAALRRGTQPQRQGAANPNYRSGKRTGVRDRDGERRWYAVAKTYCESTACPGPVGQLALHHIVYAQHVVAEHGDKHDPRNAMTLCGSCHAKHHRRSRVIPLAMLPDSAFEFAAELLGPRKAFNYLGRRYASHDPRLDALLDGEELAA